MQVFPAVLGGGVMPMIPLREEEPPDDAVVVVRGGSMQTDFVRHAATYTHDELGIYALSVFLALDEPVDQLCWREPRLKRYGKIRLSSVERLRAFGFALVPTFARPHYSVILPDLSEPTLDRLDVCFDAPIINPAQA